MLYDQKIAEIENDIPSFGFIDDGSDAIKQIEFRDAYLASKETALQSSLNAISAQTASSELLITDQSVKNTVRQLKKVDVMDVLLSDVQKAAYLINSGLLKLI